MEKIRLEFDRKESKLRDFHSEELQRIQLEADSELREVLFFLSEFFFSCILIIFSDNEIWI